MAPPKPLAGLQQIAPYIAGESEIENFNDIKKCLERSKDTKIASRDFYLMQDEAQTFNYLRLIRGCGCNMDFKTLSSCLQSNGQAMRQKKPIDIYKK